ncbi:MAG: aldehyde dehydrogenase family protein [Chitinophagaceae bacterium]
MQIINPATEEIIQVVETDTAENLSEKFQLLKAGQLTWTQVHLDNRIVVLKKFSVLLEQEIESLAAILSAEVGKPLQQSRSEINGARSRIQWITDNAGRYLSDEIMTQTNGLEERISYDPLGVICNISAWNYPYLVGVNVFVPALIAGNAVLYKPSEYATLSGIEINRLLKRSGIPEDVFQVAIGGGDVGELLSELPFNGYFFTGSYKTGKNIYKKIASKMVPCHCEMGGKDPLYVAEDILDLKAVAAATADGAFYNNGQSCCAVERMYVHESIYDDFVQELTREVQSWKVGSPMEEGVYLGPLARKNQADFLQWQVEDATKKGAAVLTGGHRIKGKGYFFEPTVLINVDHSMSLMKDESFGPVIGIMKVMNDEEAISLMQDTEYGLTAAVYCTDKQRAQTILQQINSGTGYWNCCDRVSAPLPWTGRKHSGIGVALSHAGLRSFVHPKAYHLKEPGLA